MADVELLPLPEADGFMESFDTYGCPVGTEDAWAEKTVKDYARANVEHHTEPLRAEVELWRHKAAVHKYRRERLAEALREAEKLLKRTPRATRDMYVDASPIGWGVQAGNVLAMIRAALAQEDRNG